MKTAISIDEKLFEDAEKFSHSMGLSRSKLYCNALSEYIQNHTPNIITEKLNSYYKNNSSTLDEDVKTTAHRLLVKEDW